MRLPRTVVLMLATAGIALSASGCSTTTSDIADVASSPVSGTSSVTVRTLPSSTPLLPPTATKAPSTVSDIPDGTYRTAVTQELLDEYGVSTQGDLGVWTLVLSKGTYKLFCSANGPHECGDSGKTGKVQVEQGFVRGPGPTVWFVHDLAWTRTACGTDASGKIACPSSGYRMTWHAGTDGSLQFTDFFGIAEDTLPDINSFTEQPWTKIA